MDTTTGLKVDEVSGERYPDLAKAQRLALPDFVACLKPIFSNLLESGDLIILDGRIIPNPEKSFFVIPVQEEIEG